CADLGAALLGAARSRGRGRGNTRRGGGAGGKQGVSRASPVHVPGGRRPRVLRRRRAAARVLLCGGRRRRRLLRPAGCGRRGPRPDGRPSAGPAVRAVRASRRPPHEPEASREGPRAKPAASGSRRSWTARTGSHTVNPFVPGGCAMKRLARLLPLLVVGCATGQTTGDTPSAEPCRVTDCFSERNIRDFDVIDRNTVVVYVGRQRCPFVIELRDVTCDLTFTPSIAFFQTALGRQD